MEIDKEIIEKYHNNLIINNGLITYLGKRRGINIDTIKKYKLGFNPDNNRFIIPVKDSLGNYVNLRMWQDNPKFKIISYKTGYGKNRLFPVENLKRKTIILCEGEWDCLLLNQKGFNSITTTAGVGSWDDEWNVFFKDKNIVIVFDCQDVSRKSAIKIKDKLLNIANGIKIIDLGLDNDGEDITDWYLKYKKTDEELQGLIKKTEKEDPYEKINLTNGMESKYYDKKIKFYAKVIGKDLSPYIVPYKVQVECLMAERKKKCLMCSLHDTNKITKIYDYDTSKDLLIKLLNINDAQLFGFIRKDLGVLSNRDCPGKYKLEILERQNIEFLQIIPEIDYTSVLNEYVIRRCYYFGSQVTTNQSYIIRGTTWTDPFTQVGIHLAKEINPTEDNILNFKINDEIKKELSVFRPAENTVKGINEKLKEKYLDLSYNVTKIYQRDNLLFALDLVFHSALNFKFLDNVVKRGWLELVVIGDTKQGKSKTIETIVSHYKAGEFITSGENTTVAGLLGGLSQSNGKHWIVTWGKIPLNDRKLIVIDEADKLSDEIIDLLSGVRSSGIAEIVKIQPQKTTARTRLIWVFNPRYGKMASYNFGVYVVKEFFKKQQDISRIDFILGIAEGEVEKGIMNMRHTEKYKKIYTSELCHKLIMFAWTRKSENIKWTKQAEDLALYYAKIFADDFSSEIPVVTASEIRIKLARMSVAVAIMLYNTDDTGENVIVDAVHVEIVKNYLYKIYNSDVLGYYDYSQQRKRDNVIPDKSKIVDRIRMNKSSIDLLLDAALFSLSDIEDIFNIEKREAKELISFCRKNNIFKKQGSSYKKTSAFIILLKGLKKELLIKKPKIIEEESFKLEI